MQQSGPRQAIGQNEATLESMPISKRQLDQLVGAGVIDDATAKRIADAVLLRRRAAEPASLA